MPAFGPSAIVTVAPETPLAVVLSVTVPLRENVVAVVVGVGVGVGDVVVLFPPQADANSTSRATQPRVNIGINALEWMSYRGVILQSSVKW